MNEKPKQIVSFWSNFPWKSLVAWGGVLITFYFLRHFFFVIFLTFIVSYSMRTLVVRILNFFFPTGYRRISEIFVVITSFVALLGCLYGVGSYLVPEFIRQGEGLVRRLTHSQQSPQSVIDDLLRDSVGRWLFQRQYSDKSGSEYTERFNTFIEGFSSSSSHPSQVDKPDSTQNEALLTPPTPPSNTVVSPERAFERAERARLVLEWKQGEFAAKLENMIQESIVTVMTTLGSALKTFIPKLLVFPFQLGLILLLSFFITLDVPRLANGIRQLETSRIAQSYREVAPGLVRFGQLIGRAFQAQAVIAVANSILTFISLKILGIQNEIFLCSFVFLCSFIPVLGVVFSSIPIAIMALIQDDGSLLLAFWAILAILIIHFIETSLLNPRIVGNMLHLDPVLVLAILAISEHFFGVWGLLLGVPVAVYIIREVILGQSVTGLKKL